MSESDNPLLTPGYPIPFHRIRAEHVVPGVRGLLAEAEAAVEALVADPAEPTWENTLERLDAMVRKVREGTVPVQHLLAVAESPELREGWAEVLPEVSTFWTRLHLHPGVWARLKAFAGTDEARSLSGIRARHLEKTLREFRRSGADLPEEGRARLEALEVELAQLEQKFSENVLDATADWRLHLTDESELEGIPPDAKDGFAKRAAGEDLEGWVVTLDAPSVQAILKKARSRELRRTVHAAYQGRATEEPWNNVALIPRIIALREEKARLLGYPDFPDFRLEEQMARSGERARDFLEEMVERTQAYWEADLEVLRAAGQARGFESLQPWDVAFLVEELRRERYDLDEEELRPYFPLDQVMAGMFELTHRLFGLTVEEREVEEVWHEDVRFFEVSDESGRQLGSFYADLFPRPEKRQGAWMNDFIHGRPQGRADGEELTPHLGVICGNFPPPSEALPSLLRHRDVETLFHEFGHLLHHCTSRVPIPERGGINVAWDWVEVPSQLMENWTWERDALDLFARHWDTGEPLPPELFDRMVRSRRFMGGWGQMRQLGFGVLDLALHTEFDPGAGEDPLEWVTELLLRFSPDRSFAEAHPLASFLHLFSGGYAASYYSYMWSEVMEADLFTRFLDRGIFDRETGTRYLETILSAGDREDPDGLFRAFMERDPDPEALIRRNLGDAA
ncbi:MAG: M3 family metallopeptidase [Gemmatimonadota bacterium]